MTPKVNGAVKRSALETGWGLAVKILYDSIAIGVV